MRHSKHFVLFLFFFMFSVGLSRVALAQELIVSAAASLTDAFGDIETAFEKAHPDIDVVMNFASSGTLYRQIEQGAPVDVYASANPKWMKKAVSNGFALPKNVKTFAQNSLVLVVPADNPSKVEGLVSLLSKQVKSVGIGTPETVPAGQYAKEFLVSKELYSKLKNKFIFAETVRQVLDYLVRGEIDCGFVYKTDAVKVGDRLVVIEELPLPTPVTYPFVTLVGTQAPVEAKMFVDFVRGSAGTALLEHRGFLRP